jgi:hypothetical protein
MLNDNIQKARLHFDRCLGIYIKVMVISFKKIPQHMHMTHIGIRIAKDLVPDTLTNLLDLGTRKEHVNDVRLQ